MPRLRNVELEFVLLVEVILDDALVAPGDEDEMLDPCLARLVHRQLDDRPVHHRQHFLRHGLGGWQEARSEPATGKTAVRIGRVMNLPQINANHPGGSIVKRTFAWNGQDIHIRFAGMLTEGGVA